MLAASSITLEPLDEAPGAPLGDAPRILVVDDEAANRDAMSAWLRALGYDVQVAADGPSALRLLEEGRFDAMLLDLRMPGMHGLEVLARVRERRSRLQLPVLVVTANLQADRAEALRLGANDFIPKPIEPDELEARLLTHLELRAEARQTSPHRKLARGVEGELLPVAQIAPLAARALCEGCGGAVGDDPAACPACQAQRPATGWTPIRGSMAPHLGAVLHDRYRLERFLGAGSMGVVYQARDLELNQRYAVKVIALPGFLAERRELLRDEVSALTQVHSPHVVRIYEALELDAETIALVMSYVEGISLGELLQRRGRLPVCMSLQITRQIAQGLHAVHACGLIHSDVKPQNIMVEELPGGCFVHLLDFSVAQTLDTSRTSQIQFRGTPLYAAPEQNLPRLYNDPRSDLYSLGITLYEMLMGAPPFQSSNLIALLIQHRHSPLPQLRGVEPAELGAALNALLFELTRKAPQDRIGSAAELIARLDPLLRQAAELDEAVCFEAVALAAPPPRPSSGHRSAVETLAERTLVSGEGGMGADTQPDGAMTAPLRRSEP